MSPPAICCGTTMYYYFGKDDTFVFASALPFGMNSRMQNAWMTQGGGLEFLNDFFKGYNCYAMPGGNTNAQMGGWFRKPIVKMDDLKGLKFRLGGFAGKIMQRVGAVWPHSTVPFCTASTTCRPGTISPPAKV
jgi:TRAP-type mannitol/chloroaromatic compound transport system substrate-binding protein